MPVQIKQKKGYPTTDGVMHDKNADAVKAQVGINMNAAVMSSKEAASDIPADYEINMLSFIEAHSEAVSDYIKYFCAKPKPAPKKKTTTKKPAATAGK